MTWALVPVKDLRFTKSRLASVLSLDERRALTLAMLGDVLSALSRVAQPLRRVVIGRDEAVQRQAAQWGAEFLAQSPDVRGLNQALGQGLALAAARGASRALILPADVPLITPLAIEKVLALAESSPAVGICPSADGQGTNALLLAPPGLVRPRFGHRSYHAHLAAGRSARVRVATADLTHVSLDIDEPIDLVRFLERASEGATLGLLTELRIADRIAGDQQVGQPAG